MSLAALGDLLDLTQVWTVHLRLNFSNVIQTAPVAQRDAGFDRNAPRFTCAKMRPRGAGQRRLKYPPGVRKKKKEKKTEVASAPKSPKSHQFLKRLVPAIVKLFTNVLTADKLLKLKLCAKQIKQTEKQNSKGGGTFFFSNFILNLFLFSFFFFFFFFFFFGGCTSSAFLLLGVRGTKKIAEC